MKQVNVTLTDEEHEVLVREAGKRMAISGKPTPIGALAHELLVPAINGLNGNQPPSKDSELDKSNEIKDKEVNKEADETASQLSIDFGELDI